MITGTYERIVETCPKCGTDLQQGNKQLSTGVVRCWRCPGEGCDYQVELHPKTVRVVHIPPVVDEQN